MIGSESRQSEVPGDVFESVAEREKYWQALGRFVEKFSHVERQVVVLLYRLTQIDIAVAHIAFAGMSLDKAQNTIKKLLDARPQDGIDIAEFSEVFKKLTLIGRLRNDLLHYGLQQDVDGRPRISAKGDQSLLEREKRPIASVELLDTLTADLDKISAHLMRAFAHGWVPGEVLAKHFDPTCDRPWKYHGG